MQNNDQSESLFIQVKKLEKRYEWISAADFYKKNYRLSLKTKDFLQAAKFLEKSGFCFYKAALQAKAKKEFKNKIKLAIRAYNKTTELYETIEKKEKEAKINHSKAMVAYSNYWLATNPTKKKEWLDKWWKLEIEALKHYKKVNDHYSIGKICNNLAEGSAQRINIVSDWQNLKEQLEEGFNYGEKAIKIWEKLGNENELAIAYCWTSFCYVVALWYRVIENRKGEFSEKCLDYSRKAMTLSKKTEDAYLIGHSNMSAGLAEWGLAVNPIFAITFFKDARKQGIITKDNFLIGMADIWIVFNNNHIMRLEEDPDKQREGFKKSINFAQDAIKCLRKVVDYPFLPIAYDVYSNSLISLALIEANSEAKRNLLEKAVRIVRKGLENKEKWIYTHPTIMILEVLSVFTLALLRSSETEIKIKQKTQLLKEASKHTKKEFKIRQQLSPFDYWNNSHNLKNRALIHAKIAKLEPKHEKKKKLLHRAVLDMEDCLKMAEKDLKDSPPGWKNHFVGSYYFWFAEILEQLYLLTEDKNILNNAINAYKNAIKTYSKVDLKTREAESHWQIAKLQDLLVDYIEATHQYESASEKFTLAAEKIPQLKEFYHKYSMYMKAWSQIEQAKYYHSVEKYKKAKEFYEKAAKLHKKTISWDYLTSNYFAWASIEQAEHLSRKEITQQSKEVFQRALNQFNKAENAIIEKMGEISSPEENEMNQKLLEATDLRRRFCQARIQIEDAKLLDRQGNYLQSAKSYEKAAQSILKIVEKAESKTERKEMEYLLLLCKAWNKMAKAEETTSSESFLEAAEFFEQAKTCCYTKKASLWALGNSNFCKGLAAGAKYQIMLDVKEHNKAKGYIQNAATNYLKAGYKGASEQAKATLRLFDAYLFINKAARESDTAKRVKQYQLVEKLLQLSSISFKEAQQPEKTDQVKQILETVKEEKKLAISFNKVLQRPSIASTTQSFTAPTPTSEASVGFENLQHANVQASLIANTKEVKIGESFYLAIEFINAGKEPALLTRVENFIPLDFKVVEKPKIYRIEDTCLNMKGKQIKPLKLVETKIALQSYKKGVYQLKPKVHYLDDQGQKKVLQLKPQKIKVQEVILEDRVSTGTKELNALLLGGIPNQYAIALTGPPSDEQEKVIKNFLQEGINQKENAFYITTEPVSLKEIIEKPEFQLFLCNPKPKTKIPNQPNITKLKGKTNLTNLNIYLFKSYRNLPNKTKKRICNEIISEVLLNYGAKTTRKWISEMITELTQRGFTMIAVINPEMHTSEQIGAILDLFDGEISITQSDDALDCKKSVQVKKLRGQDYIKNPICLTKQ